MYQHPHQYSISFFERLLFDIPPFFPKVDREAMGHALEHLKHDRSLSHDAIEATTISFGKKMWPYRRAFEEFFEREAARRTEEFLEAHVKDHPELATWYEEWRAQGKNQHDLFRGARDLLQLLGADERRALCEVLVAVKQDLKHAALMRVTGPEQDAYHKRVVEFKVLQEAIEERLERLRKIPDMTGEHPRLAAEIRQAVHDFEKGLAFLQDHTTFEEVCQWEARVPVRRKIIQSLSQ